VEAPLRIWTVVPSAYPVPTDGPVGAMLEATGRHPMRPAHVHFMIAAAGHETLVTHVFEEGDPYLDSDAVFGVKEDLVRPFGRHAPATARDGRVMAQPWRSLSFGFRLRPAPADQRTSTVARAGTTAITTSASPITATK